jgi:hypothetical protein
VADSDRKKYLTQISTRFARRTELYMLGDRISFKTLDLTSVGVCLVKSSRLLVGLVPMAPRVMEKKSF